MKHHLIPSRDAKIAEALGRGESVTTLAEHWHLGEHYVRRIARLNGVILERRRPTVDPTKAYCPSPAARDVLISVGIDPDTIPGRHLVCQSRDAEMMELLVVDAITLDDVGQKYGLTRERVRQLQMRYIGVSAKTFHARRQALADADRDERIAAYAAEHPAATGREIADAVKVSLGDVRDVIGPDQVALREAPSTKKIGVDDETVFEEIRRIARKPGGVPLRSTFYDAHRAPGMIGSVRLLQRFGTWRETCEAAGVQPMASARLSYTRGWSDEELRSALDQYVVDAWGTWSYLRFDEWLRGMDGLPSAQTVRNQLGAKWYELLQQSLGRVNAHREDTTAQA